MPAPQIHPLVAQKDCECVILAYVQGLSGSAAVAADFSGITIWVKGQRGATPTKNNDAVPTSSVTALVTNDPRWVPNVHDQSAPGRNFLYVIPRAAFPTADHYRVEFTFTYTTGEKFKLIFEGPARSSNG